ncbi:MAG TPA: 2,3-diphosphoglycerate-dependent phosphoglycerate mutase [Acidimicrobiales bacterium]|nr:2,3-diphosphoglycerate-dependent phosphoglycerate mutase [Acidimicrobiales bacterium]
MPSLVIVRHGESLWNSENRFTGWVDVDLSDRGEQEATDAGQLIAEEKGIDVGRCFTSVLTRAVRTANLSLDAMGKSFLPVERSWRLNERHYGALQGLNKMETVQRHGEEQVLAWRRGYETPPPPVERDSPYHPLNDPRYAMVPPASLPATECLADVVVRLIPYWEDAIAPHLLLGSDVLVVAHGNSLRALLKYLEGVSDDDIADIDLPTGIPRVYEFGDGLALEAVRDLGDPETIAAKAEAVRNQTRA